MTEREWERNRAWLMQESPRKQRLLHVTLARSLVEFLDDEDQIVARDALEVIERFANTGKTKVGLRRARQAIRTSRQMMRNVAHIVHSRILWMFEVAATENAYILSPDAAQSAYTSARSETVEQFRAYLKPLLNDIFGTPFQPTVFDLAWQTDNTVALARTMYDARDFSAMPILADALQDEGCENAAILDHCRDETHIHVRGCWVVDLVLNKG